MVIKERLGLSRKLVQWFYIIPVIGRYTYGGSWLIFLPHRRVHKSLRLKHRNDRDYPLNRNTKPCSLPKPLMWNSYSRVSSSSFIRSRSVISIGKS